MSAKNRNFKIEGNPEESQDITYSHHGPTRSLNRREALGMSFKTVLAGVTMPNLTSMLFSNTGFAADLNCGVEEFKESLPFMCFDLAGGASIAGNNVLVGFEKGGGQEDYSVTGSFSDTDYIRMGLPPSMHPSKAGMIDKTYGLAFHKESGWLKGMNSVLESMPEVQQRVDGAIFCLRTFDDSSANQLNSMYLAQKTGINGKIVSLIGTSNSLSGGNSQAPFDSINIGLKPSRIASASDATGLLNLGGVASGGFLGYNGESKERIKFLMDQIIAMNGTKLREFNKLSAAKQIQHKLNCSYNQAIGLLQQYTADVLSPDTDPIITSIFNNTDNSTAAVAKLVLDSYAGAGTVVIGGCDYHDGTSATGEAKDFQIGRNIGKVIAAAAAKGKSVLIHIFTDGAVGASNAGTLDSTTGKVIWTSDSGERSSSVLIAYKHSHNPNTDAPFVKTRQLGNFKRAGGVELTATPFSNDANLFMKIVAANILAAQGRAGEFAAIFGRDLPPGNEKYVVFDKLV